MLWAGLQRRHVHWPSDNPRFTLVAFGPVAQAGKGARCEGPGSPFRRAAPGSTGFKTSVVLVKSVVFGAGWDLVYGLLK